MSEVGFTKIEEKATSSQVEGKQPETEAEIIDSIDLALSQIDSLYSGIQANLEKFEIKNVSKAVQKYVLLRDKLSVARKSFESFETFSKDRQEGINQYLIAKSDDEGGVQNFSTPFGTAYRKTKVSYRVQDWEAYTEWMKKEDMLNCVEKRPAKTAVQEYFESVEVENANLSPEELETKYKNPVPPGLERYVEIEFGFRKS